MTPTEAKIELNNLLSEHPYRSLDSARTRKAIKTAMAALDKQVQKAIVIVEGDSICPACKFNYGNHILKMLHSPRDMAFCKKCGQALDWEE